jgi:hypothetical protein
MLEIKRPTKEEFIKILNEKGSYQSKFDPFFQSAMNMKNVFFVHNPIKDKTSAFLEEKEYLKERINFLNDELELKDKYCDFLVKTLKELKGIK